MKVGQLGDLSGAPRTALALLGGGVSGMPHEVVGDQLGTALERVEQRDRALRADQGGGGIDLHHRQPTAGRGDRIPFARGGLLANPQRIKFPSERGPVDQPRHANVGAHDCSRALLRFESFQGHPPEISPSTVLPGSKPSWMTVSLTMSPSGSMSNDTFDRLSAAQVATVCSSSCSTAVASSGTNVWKVNASRRHGSDSRMTCSGCSIFSPWSSHA